MRPASDATAGLDVPPLLYENPSMRGSERPQTRQPQEAFHLREVVLADVEVVYAQLGPLRNE